MPEEKKAQQNDEQALTDEGLEQVAGGIIDGGCIPPILKPTLPIEIDF